MSSPFHWVFVSGLMDAAFRQHYSVCRSVVWSFGRSVDRLSAIFCLPFVWQWFLCSAFILLPHFWQHRHRLALTLSSNFLLLFPLFLAPERVMKVEIFGPVPKWARTRVTSLMLSLSLSSFSLIFSGSRKNLIAFRFHTKSISQLTAIKSCGLLSHFYRHRIYKLPLWRNNEYLIFDCNWILLEFLL